MFSGGKYEKSNFRDKVVVKEELEKEKFEKFENFISPF